MSESVAAFLTALPADDAMTVMGYAEPWEAEAEVSLFRPGQHVSTMWMLDAGLVRFEMLKARGPGVVSAFASPGRCFGVAEVLGSEHAIDHAITSTSCNGWVMPSTAVFDAIERVPSFAKLLMVTLSKSTSTLLMLCQRTLISAPQERLALVLLNLAHLQTDIVGRSVLIAPVTQDMLSNILGTTPQFVRKHLEQWTHFAWITPRPGGLEIVNPTALQSVVTDVCNSVPLKPAHLH